MERPARRAKELFLAAWELPVEEREGYLQEACAGDASLAERVRGLLIAAEAAEAAGLTAGAEPQPSAPAGESGTVLAAIEALQGSAPHVNLVAGDSDSAPRPVETHEGGAGRSIGPKGNYRILGEIARGGMGVVLKGRDTDLGREVAVKVLHEDLHANPAIVQRFVEEAQIGGQLQHPGIVPVYELGLMADDRPYFTMKLVRGRTLKELLDERGGPDAERTRLVSIFEHVCQTVAYAHARRVIHRDLKPGNVMVGKFGEVQVVDWGLAKVIAADDSGAEPRAEVEHASQIETVRSGAGGTQSSHSIAGSVMGTPAYMAPEQARGEIDRLDERADVFSLGAILCEILTGQPPYGGGELPTLVQAAKAELRPALERLERCEADAALVQLAVSCLAPEPDARPRTAAVLATALAEYAAASEERLRAAQVDAATERTKATAARRVLRAATVAATAVGVALVVSLFLWTNARNAARKEQAARLAENEAKEELEQANDELQLSNDELGRALERAEEEAVKALAVSDFLTDILSSSDPVSGGRVDLSVREAIDAAVLQLDRGPFADQPDVESRVRREIGEAYGAIGWFEGGRLQLERARELALQDGAGETTDTLEILAEIGGALREEGRLEEAMETFEQVAADAARLVEPEAARLTALVFGGMASVERDRGRHGEAELHSRAALELARTTENAMLLSDILNDLSLALDAQGKLDEAIETQEEANRLGSAGRDDAHYVTAVGLSNLAGLYADAGRHDEAEAMYLQALQTMRATAGDRHPMVASCLDAMGRFYQGRSEWEAASVALRESLSIRLEALGPDDVAVAFALNNLARLEVNVGLVDEAVQHLTEARRIFIAERGEDHPSIPLLETNLANVQRLTSDRPEDLALLGEVTRDTERRMGSDHPATAAMKHRLGARLAAAGRIEEGEELLREALVIRIESLGADSLESASSMAALARVLRLRDELDEAESFARQALALRLEQLDPMHADVAASQSTLGAVLLRMERFGEAEAALLEAQVVLAASENGARTRDVLELLVELYRAWDTARPGEGYDVRAEEWGAQVAGLPD